MNKILVIALIIASFAASGTAIKERWDGTFVYKEAYWSIKSRLIESCHSMKNKEVQEKAAEPFKADPRNFQCGCSVDFSNSPASRLWVKYECYSEKDKKKIDVIYNLGLVGYSQSSYYGDSSE